jgi:hypothetical protein
MRKSLALLLSLATAAALASGCGGNDSGSASTGANSSDKRAAALGCLQGEQHLDARLLGRDSIQVANPREGPRIKFFLTSGEAEGAQFGGRAEGSEHIGTALLFVRGGSDELLEKIEGCLDNLQR